MQIRKFILIFLVILKLENWFEYFLDLFKITKNKSIIYKIRDGSKYYARTNTADRGIVNSVVLEDEYRIKNLDLKDSSTIIDIGGQNGYFSVYASKNVKKIFVYEPVLENYKNILKNIELNKLEDKIIPFNLAVSDKKGKIKIYLSKENSGNHSIYGSGDEYIEAQSITVQDIFENNNIEKCDLLKIDIEGGEYNIFYNLSDKYFEKIKNICMECHEINKIDKNLNSLVRFLRTKDYKVEFKKDLVFASK